ncbi:MAG: CPBP family intramembrane metalloprotease, partial [Chitinivibrionales bacterium]|nr:CPBP family intramembrane metalloprotease [Chitinivibrionales bacterium]
FRNGLHLGVLAFSILFGCLPFIGLVKAKAPPLSGHEIVFVGIFVVMNPAMEEVLWRGYLYFYFFPNPGWGQLLAMGFVSSLLISLFHYFVLGNISRHFRNRSSFITIFVGSSFFCVFYALTGSVLPSLVSHILIGVVGGTTLVRNHNFLHARQADEGTLSYSAG